MTQLTSSRRASPDRPGRERSVTVPLEAMGHRTFVDQHGGEWEVWDTTPAKEVSHTLSGGWLTFQCGAEKRRLAPVPLYWLNAPEAELHRLLDAARPVTPSTLFERESRS